MLQAAERVNRPELEMVTGPLAFVVALKVKLFPVRERLLDVLSAPERVVVPVPPSCEKVPALIAPKFAFAESEIVKEFKAVMAPMGAEVLTLPVPALKVRFWAPFTVLAREIFPAPDPLLRRVAPARVIGPAKLREVLFVRMVPTIDTGPVVVC